jgi:uncharacterized membrane protein
MNIELLQEAAVMLHKHRVSVVNDISLPAWEKLNNAENYINKLITEQLSDAS